MYLDDEGDDQLDAYIRAWLCQIYLYEEKQEWERTHTQAYQPPNAEFKVSFDWYPTAIAIRGYNNDPKYDHHAWADDDLGYILGRLGGMGHLKS